MKTYLYLLLFFSISISQQDSFYMGLGIINADLKAERPSFEQYNNSLTQNPYFFLGYDVTAYEAGSFRVATNFGLSYMTFENKYSSQEDKYNLMIFNMIPKMSLNITNDFAAILKLHADIKFVEFFANVDGNSDVRDKLSHLDGFETFQSAYEVGFQFSPEWLHQYSIELTYISYFTDFYSDSRLSVKMNPTFQLTIHTLL